MTKLVWESSNEERTLELGAVVGRRLVPGDVVALWGDLGAGKSVFARGIARGLGVPPAVHVTSPTFTLMNEYFGRLHFYHMDLYRLDDPEELETLPWREALFGNGAAAVEWPERLGENLPENRWDIRLEPVSEETRRIVVIAHGNENAARLDAWAAEEMAPDGTFWNGRPVFITGHTGFKGGWLSLRLQILGAVVTGYALEPPTDPGFFSVARVGEGMKSMIGDVQDLAGLCSAMKAASPEIAFHFAAQPLVRASYADPVGTYATNVMGTVHFLEAVRQTPSIQAAIVVTSDKCYAGRDNRWGYREDDPMGGDDVYSSSKGCAELVVHAYRSSFFTHSGQSVATVRAGNVIGGGDWAEDRLVPDLVRAFASGKCLELRNPHAIRPWQHVIEPLSGYLLLAERLWRDGPAYASGWNFGPPSDDASTVLDVVQKAAAHWGDGSAWKLVDASSQPHETAFLRLDSSLARKRLGWATRFDLDTALRWTIAWYRAYHRGTQDMRTFTAKQMDEYESLST